MSKQIKNNTLSEVIKDTRYTCGECEEWYENANAAIDCCPSDADEIEVYICSECDNAYRDLMEAAECCRTED